MLPVGMFKVFDQRLLLLLYENFLLLFRNKKFGFILKKGPGIQL